MENETDYDYSGSGSGAEDDDYYYYDYFCGNESYWQVRAEKAIELYVFPIIIIAGSLCNILAVVVLQAKIYRGTPTGFLMTALALADLGLLLTGILRRWLIVLTDYELDVRNLTGLGCKFNIFCTYFFQYVSAWTLVLLTVERAIWVSLPLRYKELCSLPKIIIGWVVILVVMFAVNAQFFWTYDLQYDADFDIFDCHGFDKYDVFLYDGAHNWMDLIFPSFAPFAVILVCNIVIIVKYKNMTTSKDKHSRSTTIMLLVVSFAFLLMVTPFGIYALGYSYYWWPENEGGDCATLDFLYSLFYLLFNLNSAVNFFLYYVSGARFRRAFLSVFCPKKYDAFAPTTRTQSSAVYTVDRSAQSKNGLSRPATDIAMQGINTNQHISHVAVY